MVFKIISDEFMMMVGVVVLGMFIAFDLYKAYARGAKWLPGNFLLVCGLTVQLLGYLDIQHLSFPSRHKEHDLEAVVAKQLSIDLSRLILFVFVGYLLPGLASAKRIWSNIAALTISLSSHVAMELLVFQSHVSEKGKVIKGQNGIWLIAYYYVLLTSILGLLFLFIWAVGSGRFIRDNLSGRIPSVLSRNGDSSWTRETYETEILKCWIVARVCQPEYVLGRTKFSGGVGMVLSNCVVVFTAKVICLRSQLHRPLPLLTLQFVFIIVVWLAVMYRWSSAVIYFRNSQNLFNFRFNIFYLFLSNILPKLLYRISGLFPGKLLCRLLSESVFVILSLIFCLFPFLIFLVFCGAFCLYFYICSFSWWLSCLILSDKFVEGLCRVQMEPSCEEDFKKYEPTLKRLCGPGEVPERLWAANQSSFKEMKDIISEYNSRGNESKELIEVIRRKVGGEYVGRVEKLLKPLGSVKEYFPLLQNSFRGIIAYSLLFIMSELTSDEDIKNAKKALEQARELMDFIDCPDDIGFNLDVLSTANVEAFEVKSLWRWDKKRKFVDFLSKQNDKEGAEKQVIKRPSDVENALSYIRKLQEDEEKEVKRWKLLEKEPNAEVLNTDWSDVADDYGLYKACETILTCSAEADSLPKLVNEFSLLFAELMARYVEESLEILLKKGKKWAKKFKEENINEAIHIAGLAWGVKDAAALKPNEPSAATAAADTAIVIVREPDNQ